MYFFYCFLLLAFVYCLPGLSFFPNLVSSPGLFLSIPVVSALVVGILVKLLLWLGCFNQTSLIIISFLFLIISIVRIKKYLQNNSQNLAWSKNQKIMIALSAMLMLQVFVNMGLNSFNSNDEIYSWNMWAVQHFLGLPVDFYYTKSPYPQLFSLIIAYCYKLLGSIELQMPVKCMLALFPFCMIATVATASENKTFAHIAQSCVGVVLLLFCTELNRKFATGLADPVMACAIVISARLYLDYTKNEDKIIFLWISLICAIAAAYSKQPALIWTLFAFPLLLIFSKHIKKIPFHAVAIALISIFLSLAWIFGEGQNFNNNTGVINSSFEGRNYIQQLFFSINKYFVKNPFILLIFLGAGISVFKSRKHRTFFIILILPSLFAWFLYGAYNIRLGLHIVALSVLLTAFLEFNIPFFNKESKFWKKADTFLQQHFKKAGIVLFIVIICHSGFTIYKNKIGHAPGISFKQGGKKTISKYFGELTDYVYNDLYDNPDILLWVPSNYIYGIFFGHTKMIRPDYQQDKAYSKKDLLKELKYYQPDFLFDAGVLAFGPGSKVLQQLVKEKDNLFERIEPDIKTKFGYVIYKLNKSKLIQTSSN